MALMCPLLVLLASAKSCCHFLYQADVSPLQFHVLHLDKTRKGVDWFDHLGQVRH